MSTVNIMFDSILKETQSQLYKITQDYELLTQEKFNIQALLGRPTAERVNVQNDVSVVCNNSDFNNQILSEYNQQLQLELQNKEQ